jgi:tetratricopeptide (TPR) repeat protein
MALRPAESRALTAGKWLLAAIIPTSALALGSLPTPVLLTMSVLAAIACGLLWSEPDPPASRSARWVLLGIAVLVGMTLLQSVPLPAGLVRFLAPTNAEIWDRALSPLRESGPAWHSISIAPAATRVEFLRGCFYGCVFLGAVRVVGMDDGERFVLRVVMASASVMAICALAHMAFGAETVFGVYRPREVHAYRPGRLAPLLNTNHLAAYLNVGTCVSLGALLERRIIPRALSGSITLVLAATSVWQGSRGAVGALFVGVLLTIGLLLYTRRGASKIRVQTLLVSAGALAIVIGLSIWFSDVARVHLLSRDLTKLAIAKSSIPVFASSPWVGCGRGGFETVYASVREGAVYDTFTHPEDLLVQWLVEWGLPASVVGMAILGWALRPQVVLRAIRPPIGAWVATVTAVVHELADYHLEVPGVVVLVAACAAVVVTGRGASRRDSRVSSLRAPAVAVVVGTVLASALASREIGHSLAEERRSLSAMALDKSLSTEQFREEARASMLRYPAEPFLPLMGAVRAQVSDDASVVPWVARALERSPRFGRAHFVLARSLAARHAPQARLEYRLAFENDERLRAAIVNEAVRLVEDFDSALELVPPGAAGNDMLESLNVALRNRLPATAVMLDAELERRAPDSKAPFQRRIAAAVSDAVNDAPWCATNSACVKDALAAARELAQREPDRCEPQVLVARLRIKSGDAAAALDGLERSMDGLADRAECRRQFITIALESGQGRRAELALEQLVRGGCGAASDCVDLYGWAGTMEEGRGHYVRAVRLYRLVLEITPDREDLLEHIGALGARDGVLSDALEAYRVLATRHPSDPRWPARMTELRTRSRAAPKPF